MTSVRVQFVLIFAQQTQCSSVCCLRLPNVHRREPVHEPKRMSLPLNHLSQIISYVFIIVTEWESAKKVHIIAHKKISAIVFHYFQHFRVQNFQIYLSEFLKIGIVNDMKHFPLCRSGSCLTVMRCKFLFQSVHIRFSLVLACQVGMMDLQRIGIVDISDGRQTQVCLS